MDCITVMPINKIHQQTIVESVEFAWKAIF